MTDPGGKAETQNVAVLLTPPGAAAIAVIRLAGPLNATFATAHFSCVPKVGRCVHGDLRDGDNVIDDAVVVLLPQGHLDLNVHGGPWVVQATLQLAERFGYRVTPWPATNVAFDAGGLDSQKDADKDDRIERQMLRDLPQAKSLAVLKLLAAQSTAWRTMLSANNCDVLRRALDDTALEVALAVPTVAIVGSPNVGKSTLANALFATPRSITADRPGTTRDWVGELADLDGLVVRLVDTPGVRETADAIEAAAIRQAADVVSAAACVVVAIDGSRPFGDAERAILAAYVGAIVVQTKADRPRRCDVADAIDVSAPEAFGLAALKSSIRARLGAADMVSLHARCWTDDQRYRLRRQLESAGPFI